MKQASILIPAHNEEAVIARTLWYISRGLPLDDYHVIIIANGCTDGTAARARAVLPQAEVIETDQRGKCRALNMGYAASEKDVPIICLDADLDVTSETLKALLIPLHEGTAQATCGKMEVVTTNSTAAVRAFYKGWRANPYFSRGKFGGLFALSPSAAARVFPLPEITADDEFIRRSFADDEVVFLPECGFVARAPSTLSGLINIRRRCIRGARQVASLGMTSPERGSLGVMLHRAIVVPSEFFSITFFLLIMVWVRLVLLFEGKSAVNRWETDISSRVVG